MNLLFVESSDQLGTDQEILDVIWSLAHRDEPEAFRIWEDPSERELLSVWETVTKNGNINSHEFCWDDCFDWWPYEG